MKKRIYFGGILIWALSGCAIRQQRVASCPITPVDPAYVAVAEAAGGHIYMLDPTELEKSTDLVGWKKRHTEVVFRAMGDIGSAPAGIREFSFPVDSEISSLLITVSMECNRQIAILEPRLVEAAGDRAVYRAGRALRVVRPTPGIWKIQVQGSGVYFVTAEAISKVSLDVASLPQGSGVPVEVAVSGDISFLRLRVVNSAGDTLGSLPMERGTAPGRFVAKLPNYPVQFRLAVEGLDPNGYPLQRVHAPLIPSAAPVAAD